MRSQILPPPRALYTQLRVSESMVELVESYHSLVITLQNLVALIFHIILAYVGSQQFGSADQQEAQLMLTTGSTRLAVSRGQQTWYHFGSIATFR